MNAQTSSNTLPVKSVDFSDAVGDPTYFRTSDVTPTVSDDGQTIEIVNGHGHYRSSWGRPTCTSVARRLSDSVIMVNVTGWHKHTVSPVGGSFYFMREGGQWVRRTANSKAVKAVLH